jgi:hypothetical protein
MSKAFHVVRENVHATTQMIARIGNREAGVMTAPSTGYADSVCFVATGISSDMGAKCHVSVVSGRTVVEVDFEDDTMQSRSLTRVFMHGTLELEPRRPSSERRSPGSSIFSFVRRVRRMPAAKTATRS